MIPLPEIALKGLSENMPNSHDLRIIRGEFLSASRRHGPGIMGICFGGHRIQLASGMDGVGKVAEISWWIAIVPGLTFAIAILSWELNGHRMMTFHMISSIYWMHPPFHTGQNSICCWLKCQCWCVCWWSDLLFLGLLNRTRINILLNHLPLGSFVDEIPAVCGLRPLPRDFSSFDDATSLSAPSGLVQTSLQRQQLWMVLSSSAARWMKPWVWPFGNGWTHNFTAVLWRSTSIDPSTSCERVAADASLVATAPASREKRN